MLKIDKRKKNRHKDAFLALHKFFFKKSYENKHILKNYRHKLCFKTLIVIKKVKFVKYRFVFNSSF